MADLTMPIGTEVMQRITVKVTFRTTFKLRIWLASKVLALGARIAGTGFEAEIVT